MNVGSKTFITDNTPSEKDINKAVKWRVTPGSDTYTFYRLDDSNKEWRIKMNNYKIGVYQSNNSATDFKVVLSTTTSGAYKFDAEYWTLSEFKTANHHFNVEVDANGNPTSYTGAKNSSLAARNDWLFISEAQKIAYNTYVEAYEAAKKLLNDEDYKGYFEKEPEMKAELEQILLETTNRSIPPARSILRS